MKFTFFHRSALRRCLGALLALALLWTLSPFAAAKESKRVVRVACNVNNVLELDADGAPSGCCAEYLTQLAQINDWALEYVPGNWTESIQRLADGEIDLLLPTQITPEREETMLFSALAGGYQVVGLYAPADADIYYEDFNAMNGKRIAVSDNSFNAQTLEAYAAANHFRYDLVSIASVADKLTALETGDADLIVCSTVNDVPGCKMVATMTTVPFYYAVSKDNTALLGELNQGMEELLLTQPELVTKTVTGTVSGGQTIAFSRSEHTFIQENGTLRVGFYEDADPLIVENSDGTFSGIYIDLVRQIADASELKVEFCPISRDEYAYDLLDAGQVDLLLGVNDEAVSYLGDSYLKTNPLMEYNTVAVTGNDYQIPSDGQISFVLTRSRQYWEPYLRQLYPNADFSYERSAKDCLIAVQNKKGDVTLLNTIEYNYQSKNPRFESLIEWETFRIQSQSVLVASADADPRLLSVVNKALSQVSNATVDTLTEYYLNTPYHSYSTSDSFYNARQILIFAAVLVLCGLIALSLFLDARRKNMKLLQDKNRELEVAVAAKTTFLSNMSHEIRTPMNAIIGTARLAQLEAGDNPALEEYLAQIGTSSDYLLGIINDILDMSRIDSGKFQLQKSWIEPEALIAPCFDMIQPLADAKHITFERNLPDGGPRVSGYVDVQKTRQMFMNLLNNACKFTPDGGHITFSFVPVSRDGETATDRILISDTGCGMSEAFLQRVFTPFEQERNGYTGAVQGTGLGLALSRQIARAMGGDITVESKLGVGSVFTVTLPYHYRILAADAPAPSAPEAAPVELAGKRVLMAEDHPLNATIARKLLECKGILVETAENGALAVEKFAASQPGYYDAILMDVRMPVMDGLTAARTIRAMPRPDAKAIPILAMTANAFTEDVRACLNAGMNVHLAKPIDPEQLYRALAFTITHQTDREAH